MSNNTHSATVSTSALGRSFAQDLNTVSSAQNNRLKFRAQTHKQVNLDVTEC